MKLFYWFMYLWALFDLFIANSAPVRNPERIKQCNKDVDYWELELFRATNKLKT